MSTYTIGEVAERSGFSASALRYYEGVGLVLPTARTASGYRVYDERTVERLAFIARAKQLGCSLDEITDLVSVWDGEQCGPVQHRFHELVTAKIADAERRTAELASLTDQLRAAAMRLSGPASDGPCGDDCACLVEAREVPGVVDPAAITLVPKPDVPIACTLDGTEMTSRMSEWEAVMKRATGRPRVDRGTWRVEFDAGVSLPALAALVAAEAACCAFLSFALTVDQRGLGLEARAPDGGDGVLAILFGPRA